MKQFVSGKCASLGCGNVVYVQDTICENCPNKGKTFEEVYPILDASGSKCLS